MKKSELKKIIKEEIRSIKLKEESNSYKIEMARSYSFDYSDFVNIKSIKFSGDMESWFLDFILRIPKSRLDAKNANQAKSELSKELNYHSHGVEGNPGGSYSKSGLVNVEDGGDIWIVKIGARGGLDI